MPETLTSRPENVTSNDLKWIAQYDRLKQYMAKHDNHVPYPRIGQDSEIESIGQWVGKQRKLYRNKTLEEWRQKELLQTPEILIARQYIQYAQSVIGNEELQEAQRAIHKNLQKSGEDFLSVDSVLDIVDSAINKITTNK